MARQRQIFTHPHHHPHHHRRQQPKTQPSSMIAGDPNCTPLNTSPGAYSPSSSVSPLIATSPTAGASKNAGFPGSAYGDRSKQNWKMDNHGNTDWKLLLQKVLKQSDVGNLGRIVLPKKEAEINLPLLDTRDGINIDLEDISTSRVWTMRYRYWPNNKSRMYLLENTGDFVRANNLQEGDFIVLYWDVRKSKYMIRAVKVPDNKNPSKTQKQFGINFAGDNVAGLAPASMATG